MGQIAATENPTDQVARTPEQVLAMPCPATPAPRRSLRALAIRGSAWSMMGYGSAQVLRLGSNLVTTRLLMPEAFGLMALVQVWMQGLQLFSDLGINQNIIQSEQGDEQTFLDTAFTVQVIRGVLLWIVTAILAWPMAVFYEQPMLLQLLPVAGISAVLFGLVNTSMATHSRHLALGRITVNDLVAQVIQLGVMIGLVWWWQSVWGLVIGGLVGGLVRLVSSHTVMKIYPNRFRWDRDCVQSLVRFGRWILFSSMLGFFVNRGDVLIMGKFVPAAMLGVFHIGSQFAMVVRQCYFKLANNVLFPIHVKLGDDNVTELCAKVRTIRLGVMALMLPPLWLFVLAGPWLIELLYDDRYLEAGRMLQILACGTVFTIVPDVGPIFLARGNSLLLLISLIVRSVLLLAAIIVGASLFGVWGVVTGIACASALYYPFQIWVCRRYDVWLPTLDLLGFGASALVIGGGLWLQGSAG